VTRVASETVYACCGLWTDPSSRKKRKKIQVALKRANTAFISKLTMKEIDADDYPDRLLFMVGDIEVCETVFVNVLGMETPCGYKSKTWTSEVDYLLGMFIAVVVLR
jgi:hypothetical protein